MDTETEAAFGTLRDQVDRRFEAVDQRFEQLDRRFEAVDRRFEQLDHRIEATAVETRREFHIVAESLRSDIRLLAEGFSLRCDRLESTLRDEMTRSHDALASLFRAAYTDLDRRVTALERRPHNPD